ncbi:hypothetical protein, partial [Kamptonema formosum]|uniref:hypothetical protein n=1 Tax=Kamptonema formosum TaxID=331992 RepID=UPI001E632F74
NGSQLFASTPLCVGTNAGGTDTPHLRRARKNGRGVDTFADILCTNGSQLFASTPLSVGTNAGGTGTPPLTRARKNGRG